MTQNRPSHDKIIILDFGSQVTQLIARRIREIGVYTEIVDCRISAAALAALHPKAVILSGGPASVTAADAPAADAAIFDMGVPVMGICYGLQTMAKQLGGAVAAGATREFGRATLTQVDTRSPLFNGIWQDNAQPVVWMSHGDSVTALPAGFKTIAANAQCRHAAIADDTRRFYGVQFHPEVIHTPAGTDILRRFVLDIAGCKNDWTAENVRDDIIDTIRKQVGDEKVICGVSGGVDSTVVAALLHEAIGDNLTCVFVDHGLMRKDEAAEVIALFRDHLKVNFIHEDAADLFLTRLDGIDDPEQKRKIIGATFIDVFEQAQARAGTATFLAQGTLYPDVIESVAVTNGTASTIKSHHNVGGLPEDMAFKLVEPLRMLFKDEVRALGTALNLPEKFIGRHPFPGPGLAIRIMGAVTREKRDILQQADAIFIEELHKNNLYNETWQAFCVLLPVKTVGVMGDARTYDHVLALRAVTSVDGMTADYAALPHDFLGHVATRIINDVNGINRIVYDITSKPPGTIEWE